MTRCAIRWILAGAPMPTALLPAALATAVLISAVLVPVAPAAARENLLKNPGAEDGETGWRPFFLERGDARLEVAAGGADGGGHAFVVRSGDRAFAMWQQRVPVEAGRVYEFSARMKVEDVRGRALLHVVFRGADGQILELVDLLPHSRTIDWFFAYPAPMLVRAPDGAATAEVNLCLQGGGTAWFDDVHFGPPAEGTVCGTVTCKGEPAEGVRVYLYGSPFEARTDAAGRYTLARVPVRSPRYILMAEKDGLRTAAAGDLGVEDGRTREVNLELARGADPADPQLRVKFGCLRHIEPAPPRRVDPQAVVDASRYPAAAKVYLGPNEFIDSQSPAIREVAAKVLASVPEGDRGRTLPVAEAVFGWIIRNIEFDTTYDPGDAARRGPPADVAAAVPGRPARFAPSNFTDTTSGKWQTISPTGWCWGHNFADWLYKPSECLAAKRGICIEHSRLATALLRACGIPARPVKPYGCQFWVQMSDGSGYWSSMSTNGGRAAYRERGETRAGFPSVGLADVHLAPLDAGPIMHSDWHVDAKGPWREVHPWSSVYPGTDDGRRQALADLAAFAATGEDPRRREGPRGRAPRPARPERPPLDAAGAADAPRPPVGEEGLGPPRRPPRETLAREPRNQVEYSDVTINLLTVGGQERLRVRFPFPAEVEGSTYDAADRAFWTNYPEAVVRTWVSEERKPPAEGTARWFNIEFDVAKVLAGRVVRAE